MTGNFIGRFRHRDTVTKVCEPVQDDWNAENPEPAEDGELEPSVQSQRKANEQFARNSDRKNGYDNGRPTEDELSKMSPIERFCAASAARNRLNPRYADEARRRRRSE
jgi:hypothetical protein